MAIADAVVMSVAVNERMPDWLSPSISHRAVEACVANTTLQLGSVTVGWQAALCVLLGGHDVLRPWPARARVAMARCVEVACRQRMSQWDRHWPSTEHELHDLGFVVAETCVARMASKLSPVAGVLRFAPLALLLGRGLLEVYDEWRRPFMRLTAQWTDGSTSTIELTAGYESVEALAQRLCGGRVYPPSGCEVTNG